MRISTSKQHPCVRGPLREFASIQSGASGLPYYCAPLVYISTVIGLLTVWWHHKPKKKQKSIVAHDEEAAGGHASTGHVTTDWVGLSDVARMELKKL